MWRAGWGYIIVEESGGAEGAGWSNTDVTDAGSAGRVHGPWGNSVRDVHKTFSIGAGVTHCTVSWRSWSIDSRDNEWDRVFVDESEVWADQVTYSGAEGWTQCCEDFPQHWDTGSDIHFIDVSVLVPCSGSLVVHFTSGLDEGVNNEAWAFSDFRIVDNTPRSNGTKAVSTPGPSHISFFGLSLSADPLAASTPLGGCGGEISQYAVTAHHCLLARVWHLPVTPPAFLVPRSRPLH